MWNLIKNDKEEFFNETESDSKISKPGVPFMAQQLTNPTRIHEDEGSVPGLAQWVKDPALL